MELALGERVRAAFAPPRALAPTLTGIDLSASGVKAVELKEGPFGLILARESQTWLESGAFANGDIVDRKAVVKAIKDAAKQAGVRTVNAALPESKMFLFETEAAGTTKDERRVSVEQRLAELVPLSPPDTAFDFVPIQAGKTGGTQVAGVAFARRIVDSTLAALEEAGLEVRALEGESFAMARALLPRGDQSTTLIIDMGKSSTKIAIVSKRVPRFTATISIGGHALTLAVQKYFGVTEAEARRVKAEKGIVSESGNEEYIAAMLSSISAIRDEIAPRLEFWQNRAASEGHEKVTHAILAGGNASVRGLPEYLQNAFQVPVSTGDVFTNLASRDHWLPQLEYNESLAYATVIGLALRERLS